MVASAPPTAVGCLLRRLVAKCACRYVAAVMAARLSNTQIGFGIPKATEAAAHATRCYISQMHAGQAMLKLDFTNAFNSIHRDIIL